MRKFFSILIIICGILLASYPWISNYVNERAADGEINVYEENVQNMDEEKLKEYLLDAQEYNAALLDTRIALIDPFDAEFNKLYKDTPYSNLLNYDSQGIMGFLEIPAIKVKLPIYHGTSPAVLQKGVGHLEGSSLPVGGESTHSILTGHTGLNKAKLFTDLTSVQKGDMFFVSVLGRKMAYVVDDINVVLPDDTSRLQVVEGKDYVTLITFTPYGVIDHRLLVRGVRNEYTAEEYEGEQKKDSTKDSLWISAYKKALAIGVVAVIVLAILLAASQKVRSRKEGIPK